MHMMFVDESGDPGYPKDGNWNNWKGSTHFARVGVIIHGWKWKAWNDRLMKFKQDRALSWGDEIKASDLRKGKGAFVGWDRPERELFLRELCAIIGDANDITLIGVAIDKTRVDNTRSDRLTRPEVRSLELLLERYNGFFRAPARQIRHCRLGSHKRSQRRQPSILPVISSRPIPQS